MSKVQTGQTGISVTDRNGTRGTLDLAVVPPEGKKSPLVLVRFSADARQAFIASGELIELKEGGYFYPESFDDAVMNGGGGNGGGGDDSAPVQQTNNLSATTVDQLVVPIVVEELNVEKRQVVSGVIRIAKTVSQRVETVDLPLMEEQTEVERVAVGRIVETAPPVRYEGDLMIVPLLEEVIVVEKRLLLREELHIRKRQIETHKPQQVALRSEQATIERVGGNEQREINDKTP